MVSGKGTVMIVEDEPDAAEMFAEMMRIDGFNVLKLYSSLPALAALSSDRPDAVILDVMMADVSGLEVLRFIRHEPRLDGLPVIIVSARGTPADIKTGLEAGASLYLTKPVGFLELKRAVDRLVHKDSPRRV